MFCRLCDADQITTHLRSEKMTTESPEDKFPRNNRRGLPRKTFDVPAWHWIGEIGADFWQDKIETAGPCSIWLWGERKPKKFYHLVETSNFPHAYTGSQLAIRKSVVRASFWAQERKAFASEKEEELVKLGILLSKLMELIRQMPAPGNGDADTSGIHLWMALLQELLKSINRLLNEI
jgi:hypothetical protein